MRKTRPGCELQMGSRNILTALVKKEGEPSRDSLGFAFIITDDNESVQRKHAARNRTRLFYP